MKPLHCKLLPSEIVLACTLTIALWSGCATSKTSQTALHEPAAVRAIALTKIEYPDAVAPIREDTLTSIPPRTIREMGSLTYWDLTLEDAVRLALENSKVLRDLGGTVVRSPDASVTSTDPAIQETDPRFGVEAALSDFDAQLLTTLNSERIDRRLNNRFLGDLGFLSGQKDQLDTQISKRTATGTQFFLRQHLDFDRDNNLGNQFPGGAANVFYEGEVRQPLLQGNGLDFNRIAGPNGTPGSFNGVLIARIRTDVSLADFEIGLRDFVSNVENAYWDLYYSYRDLDAKVRARDTALETWRRIQALNQTGRRGGEAEKEAQAREQFFRFEAEAQDSLAGRPLDGTRTNNGSRPGTFRGLPGVLVNERRLRLLMNVPTQGEELIRPAEEPSWASVVFDWSSISAEALVRRAELRRQRWQLKRRELELIAARNFLMPQLDLVGKYRFRGFGDDLINPDSTGLPRFDNAFMDLTSGDFQEWQVGVELSMPLGFRQAYAGVRNAELRIVRERSLLDAQEREIICDLSLAISELDRSYLVMHTNYNRWVAARQQLAAVDAAFQDDRVEFIAVLDAQRRYAEAESQQYRSRVEYAVALKNVHFEKGTMLDYLGIASAEGPWPGKAYDDALRRDAMRGRVHAIPRSALIISTETPTVELPASALPELLPQPPAANP
ncbi:Outer membrane efflux protein [Anatilimnocola aggregata]|uniref:Outer membrane efflux protein n=1 Tax=Anatilimnocola aggregata TaxID=2528021 RepID=A0A517YE17_9BACT|nr:TolC family protein [Anatilimnocola aggregata]QDU28469.1 Outer membrane efflux protein [Anatilimnocola aggregata]